MLKLKHIGAALIASVIATAIVVDTVDARRGGGGGGGMRAGGFGGGGFRGGGMRAGGFGGGAFRTAGFNRVARLQVPASRMPGQLRVSRIPSRADVTSAGLAGLTSVCLAGLVTGQAGVGAAVAGAEAGPEIGPDMVGAGAQPR